MRVKVWNDNTHPYEEDFKGEIIKIGPKGFIEMDFEDATDFKSAMGNGMQVGNDGVQTPESYKMIRIERRGAAPRVELGHKCMSCSKSYESPEMLDLHVTQNHKLELTDSKVGDELQAKVDLQAKGSGGKRN